MHILIHRKHFFRQDKPFFKNKMNIFLVHNEEKESEVEKMTINEIKNRK